MPTQPPDSTGNDILKQIRDIQKNVRRALRLIMVATRALGMVQNGIQFGVQLITPSAANTPTTVAITFATPFPTGVVPQVQVSIQSTAILNASVGYTAVTNTGFNLTYCSPSTTGRNIGWLAYA